MNTTILLIAIIIIIILIVVAIISIYNKMVANKNRMQEAWSGIDVFMKKRYDLIPNLVETVKGYASHEKSTFQEITASRSAAINAKGTHDKIESEMKLDKALVNLFAVAENYPELKANDNFKQLQSELSNLETDIERARRYYNGTVRENNIYIESFPNNLLAGSFNFQKGEYFNIAEAERSVPKVSF